MDRAVTVSDANQRFSELLRSVQDGETIIVTSRGRPVAKVMPVDDLDRQGPALEALLTYLEHLPRRRAPGWRREDLYE